MMKGVLFNDTHSYVDLNLVLSKVDIPPAIPKTNYIDIPGGDGSIDLTEAHGDVKYKDRPCQFVFTLFPTDDFEEKKREVSNLLNGQRCRIQLDKDPDYYWMGRCSIDQYSSNKNLHQIVVGATVAPYKLKIHPTTVSIPAGESVTKVLRNGRKKVVPTLVCTADTTVMFNDNEFIFHAGTHKDLNIILVEGANQVTVTSTGTVEFTYQEGEL